MASKKIEKVLEKIEKLLYDLTDEERGELAGTILDETSMTNTVGEAFFDALGTTNHNELLAQASDRPEKEDAADGED
jgi:hypothetical protein